MENALNPNPQQRLSVKEMKTEVLSHFYFERGILFTFSQMLWNPERLVDLYLNEDRRRVFNPFRYLLVGVAVSTIILLNHPGFKQFMADIQSSNANNFHLLEEKLHLPLWQTMLRVQEIYLSYQNILIIISIPAISWVTKKYFKKKNFNFAEHMVVNAFIFGTTYWLSSLLGMFTYFFSEGNIFTYIISALTFVVSTYLYHRIFKANIFKSFLGILLAYIPIYIIAIIVQGLLFVILLMML